MRYKLLQLKQEKLRDYGFMDYEFAKEHGFDINDYEQVYEGEIDASMTCQATAERLFEKFNINRPEDFHGRSMSVGDILVLGDCEVQLYCEAIGFRRINW